MTTREPPRRLARCLCSFSTGRAATRLIVELRTKITPQASSSSMRKRIHRPHLRCDLPAHRYAASVARHSRPSPAAAKSP
jgi:hypothetical protein